MTPPERALAAPRTVTVTVSDLPKNAVAAAGAVRAAVSRCGSRDVKVSASEDETELIADFMVDAPNDGAAREAGDIVLSAVQEDSFARTVAILTPYRIGGSRASAGLPFARHLRPNGKRPGLALARARLASVLVRARA